MTGPTHIRIQDLAQFQPSKWVIIYCSKWYVKTSVMYSQCSDNTWLPLSHMYVYILKQSYTCSYIEPPNHKCMETIIHCLNQFYINRSFICCTHRSSYTHTHVQWNECACIYNIQIIYKQAPYTQLVIHSVPVTARINEYLRTHTHTRDDYTLGCQHSP